MNKTIYVEFMFEAASAERGANFIRALGDRFQYAGSEISWDDNQEISEEWLTVSGKIDSETATLIKLGDKFYADRMRVSYISNELKDKWRR